MILFLDTPRSDNGLNHRYFVASLDGNSEAGIHRFSQLARESNAGVGYLAASRGVQQVSRGQIRDGLELLVLAGIPSIDPALMGRLHNRLREMLESIPDTPISVPESSVGLLIPSRMIAGMEVQLLDMLPPARQQSNPAAGQPRSPSKKKFGFIPLISIVVVMIAAWLMVQKLQQAPDDTGRSGENSTGTEMGVDESDSSKSSSGSKQKNSSAKNDWQFLKNNDWRKLAQLTGLPNNWVPADAESWATSLMREADPDFSGDATAQDFRGNPKICLLVEAADQPTGPDGKPDVDAVFKRWIDLRGNAGKTLVDLAYSLGDSGLSIIAVSDLREMLSDWERALLKLAKKNPEVERIVRPYLLGVSSGAAISLGLQESKMEMVTESDLRRYNAINAFLNNDYFTNKIAAVTSGEYFEHQNWRDKVKRLGEIGNMPNVDKTIAGFCKELHESASKIFPR